MLLRFNPLSHLLCFSEICHCLDIVSRSVIDSGKSNERVQRMPVVFRCLHHLIGCFVFGRRLVVFPRFLVERTKIGVAERDSEFVFGLCIECHWLEVIHPCRVCFSLVLEDRTNISIVDGLSHRAVQASFACQRHTQRTVGTLVVTQCQIDIPQSIERYHTVLLSGERRIGTLLTQLPCTVMVFLRHIEHTHASVVCTDIVQCLHQFKRIADAFCLLLPFTVYTQSFLETTFVAQCLAPFS